MRAPLRGDGGARQGRRTSGSGGRLVVAEESRCSKVTTGVEEGSGKSVCKGRAKIRDV